MPKYGNDLADSVEAVLAKKMKPVAAALHTNFEIIGLPFEGELNVEQLQAVATKDGYLGRCARGALERLQVLNAQGKKLPDAYPYPVQVWRLGADQLLVALGGEVVVDTH